MYKQTKWARHDPSFPKEDIFILSFQTQLDRNNLDCCYQQIKQNLAKIFEKTLENSAIIPRFVVLMSGRGQRFGRPSRWIRPTFYATLYNSDKKLDNIVYSILILFRNEFRIGNLLETLPDGHENVSITCVCQRYTYVCVRVRVLVCKCVCVSISCACVN